MVNIFIKKKLLFVIPLVFLFVPIISQTQIFSYCQKEIGEYCATKISEQETISCLKRRSNLLGPSCFKKIGAKFTINTLAQLQNENTHFERYQNCLLSWKNNWIEKKYRICKAYSLIGQDPFVSQCMNDIKLKRQRPVEDQFEYEVASFNMCQHYLLKNKEWKNCYIKNKEKREDYTITFNMCDNKIKKCLEEQSSRRGPSQSDYPECFLKYGGGEEL